MIGIYYSENIRPVQSEFMRDVTGSIENSTHLIANAPTGLGKTAASLTPVGSIAIRELIL